MNNLTQPGTSRIANVQSTVRFGQDVQPTPRSDEALLKLAENNLKITGGGPWKLSEVKYTLTSDTPVTANEASRLQKLKGYPASPYGFKSFACQQTEDGKYVSTWSRYSNV